VALSVGVVAVFAVTWSGVYNVAASSGHWPFVEAFLRFGMRQSVELRAMAVTAPRLDDPHLVRLGAAHFEIGCAFCHGSPAESASPVTDMMLPAPPSLSGSARVWKDEELFRIVRHGIKYTGMPGWVAIERPDEVWSLIAFLKRLPDLDAAAYRELAFDRSKVPAEAGERPQDAATTKVNVELCGRCHGVADTRPKSTLVPLLHGQPKEFLVSALRNYRSGQRRSGIMKPVAAQLDDQEIERLADYYAGLAVLPAEERKGRNELIARGRDIARYGKPSVGVPPCIACHGRDALASYPRLSGQNAAYMTGQLRLWRDGHNDATPGAAVMAPIARQLSDQDIEAAVTYFASSDARKGQ
jgi:cytochrome c553